MSVVEGERRTPEELEVLTKARELAIHTSKVCRNRKTFPPELDLNDEFVTDIVHTARDIYLSLYEANDIRVGKNPVYAHDRLTLQSRAISKCRRFSGMLMEAQRQFHFSLRRLRHWAGLAKEVRDLAVKWHESDVDRYGKI